MAGKYMTYAAFKNKQQKSENKTITSYADFKKQKQADDEYENYRSKLKAYEESREAYQSRISKSKANALAERYYNTPSSLRRQDVEIKQQIADYEAQQELNSKKNAEDYIFMNYSVDRQKSTIENLQKQLDYAKSYNQKKRTEFATSDKTVVGAGNTEKPAQVNDDYIADLEDKINRYAGIYYNSKNQTALSQMEKLPEQQAQYEAASKTDADNDVLRRLLDKVNTGNFEWDEDYDYIAERFGITTDDKSMEQYRDELMAALDEGKQFVNDTAEDLNKLNFDYEGLERYKAMLKAQEEYDAQVQRAQENYEAHPILTNLGTIANAPGMAIEAGVKAIKSIGHNDVRDLDTYEPMNKYNMPVTTYVNAVREATNEDIDSEVLSLLYNSGMSIADSTVLALALGPAATAVMSSGSAVASYMQDAVDRGLSNKQTLTGALAAGAAEAVFEYFSIDKLLNGAMNANTVKELLKSVGVQAIVEGTEEMFTEVANIISDGIIAGKNSSNAKLVEQYMAQGMTEEEAKKQVVLDNIKNIALAGLGGAISGGITAGGLGGVSVATETIAKNRAEAIARDRFVAKMQKEKGYADKTANLLKNSYQTYSKSTKEPISLDKYAEEFDIAYEYGKNGVNKEYVMKKEHTPHMSNTQLENAYDEGVIARLKTEGKKAVDSNKTQDYTNITEVNDEEEIRLRGIGNGLDGENTGGTLRELEESTGRDQNGRETSRPADVETASLTYGEKVSTSSLGILGGSDKADIRLVKGGETTATKEAKAIAKQRGLSLVLFAGDNLHIEQRGSDGKLYNISARAFVSGDRVFVRADHPVYTSDKLMKHEAGHDMIAKGEVNPDTVRDRIKNEFTEEGTAQLVDEYIKGYEGSGMTPEEIWEELICDSLADMNVFSDTKYEGVEKILQPEVKKAATKPDAKTDTTRGPPAEGKASRETKYWRPDITKSQLRDLEEWVKYDIQRSENSITESANWGFKKFNGMPVFVIYSTLDESSPTILYESKDAQAEYESDLIRDYLEDIKHGKSINGKTELIDAILSSGRLLSSGGNGNNYGAVVGRSNSGNVQVLRGQSKRRPSPAFESILRNLLEVPNKGRASRELKTTSEHDELLNQLLSKRAELNESSWLQDDIEDSDEYNNLVKEVVASEASVEALAKYNEWDKRVGYSKLVEKNKQLAKEARELAKQYDDFQRNSFEQAEKAAITKSGLSEADYFRKQAVKEFGYTPYFYDAGYLLPNGKMLNFSGEKGKHYGIRGEDHRGIGTIYAETQGADALIRFMNDGNIRVMAETPGVDIFSKAEPTSEQYSTIKKFINEYAKEKFFSVDLSDANGRNVGSLQYENNINATRIINDIKHFYATGEIRAPSLTSQFHYSREIEGMDKLRREYARIRTDISVLSNAANALDESAFNKGEGATLERFKTRLDTIRETEDLIYKYRKMGDKISAADKNRLRNAERRVVNQYSELFDSVSKPGVKAITNKASELLIQKYGSIEPGEKPFREVSVPARTNKGNKVSQTVRTTMEAEVTSDEMVERLSEEVVKGGFSYLPITDAESKKYADDTIKRKGWNDALLDWNAEVSRNQLGKNNVALGFQLYNNALNAGDTETAVRILTDLAGRVREGAQMVQAVRMLKKLSPEYQLYGIQRSVQSLQEDINKRYGKDAPTLQIDPKLVENYKNAKTDEEKANAEEALYRNIASQLPHTFLDKWNSWRYLAMLFNIRTHARNIVGNAIFVPARSLKTVIATGLERTFRLPTEARTKAIVINKDLFDLAKADYSNVEKMLDSGGKYDDFVNKVQKYQPAFGSGWGAKYFNKASDLNSTLLGREDAWFSKPAYAEALAGYLTAQKITTDQWNNGEISQAKMDEARAYAVREAQRATYRDMNDFSNWVAKIGNRNAAGNGFTRGAATLIEGILPFRRTPANVLARGFEYSPLGLIKAGAQIREIVRANQGKEIKHETAASVADVLDTVASSATGSVIIALGVALACGVFPGLRLVAGGPDDEKEKDFFDLLGGQSYALEVGDKSVTIDWLAPVAIPLFIGAEIGSVIAENEKFDWWNALNMLMTISEPMLELSMLSGVQDTIDNIKYADRPLMSLFVNMATSYIMQGVPTLFGQIERVFEPERMATWINRDDPQLKRDIDRFFAKLANKVPGWEVGQIPYIDAWGRTEYTGEWYERAFNNLVNPAYTSDIIVTELDEELQRLYDLGYDEVLPSGVAQNVKIDGEYLSMDDYVKYAETRGKGQYELLDKIRSADWYNKLSDFDKSEVIKKAYDYNTEVAKNEVVPSHELPDWISEAKDSDNTIEAIRDQALSTTSNLKDRYLSGEFSESETVERLMEYKGYDEEKAKSYITQWKLQAEYPEYSWVDNIQSANKFASIKTGISAEIYNEYYTRTKEAKGTDNDGDGKTDSGSKKKQVMDIINSLNISNAQKDTLYLLNYKESTIEDAPWH